VTETNHRPPVIKLMEGRIHLPPPPALTLVLFSIRAIFYNLNGGGVEPAC